MLQRDSVSRGSALAALFAFVLYLPRVAPTLTLMGDSAVFVSAATTWGVPQPSGYPLWTTLGFLWSKLPLGEVAHRLHLLSAVLHALTVFVVGCTIALLTRSRLAALTGALWLAFSRAFFLGSLYTEVFPLNDLFTALALYGGFLVYRAPTPGRLGALALIAGLASAHHQTIALLAPALAVLVAKGIRRVRREHFALFLAPILFSYALIPLAAWREPFASWGDVRSFSALVSLVTRRDYGGLTSPHLGSASADGSTLVSAWIDGTLLAFTGWVLLAIAVGLWAGWRTDRRVLVSLCLAVLIPGPIFAVMNRLEVDTEHGRAFAERFSTQAAIPIAILVGLGVAFAYRALREQLPASWLRVALGLSAMIPLARHVGDCDLRDDRRGLAVAHDTLHDIPDGALVLVAGDALNGAALYLCGVEKRCGHTVVFSPGQMHLDWRVAQLRRRYPEVSLPSPAGKFLTSREIVAAKGAPGFVVFFHGNTLHASAGNLTPVDRLSIFISYNTVANALQPVANPRPAFISERDFTPLDPLPDDALLAPLNGTTRATLAAVH